MYARMIVPPRKKSFFLFGPRGTGKTTWLKERFPKAVYLDLLEAGLFNDLTANPQRLERFISPDFQDWIILDEIQRIPELLNEVHRLIEARRLQFILTGSSARNLRKRGVNLLAGRALTYRMYPLTALELGADFSLTDSLRFGHLPAIFSEPDKQRYLESYVMTYLEEEIRQEGLTRNLGAFSRFLEAASFSQGAVINFSEVARECGIHRKMAEQYFSILDDLMIAYRLPVFAKRAKRRLVHHSKFYFFDVGVYRTLRPHGPLDAPEEEAGMALESLVFQEMMAINDYRGLGFEFFFWRTVSGAEVDFVLYGRRGLVAIEVKRTSTVQPRDIRGLKSFSEDYPEAKLFFLYGGNKKMWEGTIQVVPVEEFLRNMMEYVGF